MILYHLTSNVLLQVIEDKFIGDCENMEVVFGVLFVCFQVGFLIVQFVLISAIIGSMMYMRLLQTRAEPSKNRNHKTFTKKKRVLFLITKPSDECMFFGPSILRLAKTCEIHLLSITKGKNMLNTFAEHYKR